MNNHYHGVSPSSSGGIPPQYDGFEAELKVLLNNEAAERTQQAQLAAAETIKRSFTVSPNPARNQVNVTYQFPQATDATIEVKAASGQVISS